ncbi:hypothetical protein [Nevskia sp.]|uniref:hypothetical protein n=1 Tax=Nevskia sp. TaxID=1929292 RepID=UPI0025DAEFA5|nr:hypothetical protein [Nevskia sp.]
MKKQSAVETTWWLEWGAVPALHWARLQICSDGTAVVLDLDGRYHTFKSREEAHLWLAEDEYSLAENVVKEENLIGVTPPHAANDEELIPLMLARETR